jgi:hypothetical protein
LEKINARDLVLYKVGNVFGARIHVLSCLISWRSILTNTFIILR